MSELLLNLNKQQEMAVTHDQGPLLIVAGAGTGKTTVIASRIAYLIEKGRCKPEEVLALTFTDRAAGEMEERVDKLLPYGYVDLWISTFHSFAERILKENGLDIGLPTDFKLLSTTGQWMLIKNNLSKFDIDYYKPLGNPTKYIHNLLKHFSRAKDENITPEEYQKYVDSVLAIGDQTKLAAELLTPDVMEELEAEELNQAITQELQKLVETARAYSTYQQLLLDNNCLDFGDLITYLLKLFTERKNILALYRSKFKYILVDEFQDTNFAQYQLIKMLATPKNNVTVVGDDDQAIYKFRGASISNILQFKDDYPQAQEVFLNTNYRSDQNILDLSYQFIQLNNPYRLEIKLAKSKTGSALSKKLEAHNIETGVIEHLHGQSLEDESKLVVDKIIDIYNKDENLKWSDFAILVRANSSANEFIYSLERSQVPYNFLASKGLYTKKIILDVLSFLKLLDNYHESVAMYRIISMPLFAIPHAEIMNFNYWANRKGVSLYESLRQAGEQKLIKSETQSKVSTIIKLITDFSELANSGKRATEIIQGFIDKSGYLKALTTEDSDKNHEELLYLNQFFKKVQDFEKENDDKSVKSFLNLIELELESGEEGSLQTVSDQDDPDTVKIMTVHASKGLEFEYVFLPNMVDKRFPTTAKGEAISLPDKLIKEIVPEGDVHLQEERRLFYVAMTRAKHGLYFSSAENYGGVRSKKISRFLQELHGINLPLSDMVKTTAVEKEIKQKAADEIAKPKLPAKFSFTRLKAFETCPYQYRFAFILKVPTPGKPQFSYGRTMHNTLQKVLTLADKRLNAKQLELIPNTEKKTVDLEDVLDIYRDSFIDDWFQDRETKDKYYAKGEKSVKEFYEQNKDHWPQTMYLEYPFNLHIKNGDENFTLYGVIDRIDKIDGGVRIVDYKTGSIKEKLTLENKEQLLIYQMAVEEVLKEPVKELVFHYLDDNKEMTFLGTDKELEKTKAKILKNIEGLKLGEFEPKPSMMCNYCDFNSICEFKSKS